MKNYINLKFVLATLIITVIIVPIIFNFLFLWESGFSKGNTSDWFVLYGNIFGGLIGGFFTYLALLLTLDNKEKEKKPKIDIPHQSIDFLDNNSSYDYKPIVIEFNNIGGSVAKNIECKLSLENFEVVLSALKNNMKQYRIDIEKWKTQKVDDVINQIDNSDKGVHLVISKGQGEGKISLGSIRKNYNEQFIGSCIPLVLNHDAKAKYILEANVSNWINYIILNREYSALKFNKDELFDLTLEIKYSSDDYGDFHERFKLEWDFIGMYAESSGDLKFQYVLKSTKVK